MPDLTHKYVSAVSDDADASTVSPSDWNARLQVGLSDSDVLERATRHVVAGTDRLTAAGTSELRVLETFRTFRGTYAVGSVAIVDDTYLLQYKRATVAGTARVSVFGTGELFIFNLAPVGRLVLAGSGT